MLTVVRSGLAVALPRFDRVDETEYRRHVATASLTRHRVAVGLAIILYLGFGALEVLLDEPHLAPFVAIRVAFAAWLLLVLAATTRPWWTAAGQALIVATVILGSGGIAVMITVAERQITQTTFFAGNVLVVMFASGFGLLRTGPAAVATVSAAVLTVGLGVADGLPGVALASSLFFMVGAVVTAVTSSSLLDRALRANWAAQRLIESQRDTIAAEKARADGLLADILPGSIAERLKGGEKPIADGFADVTVLFADLQSFTQLAARLDPMVLVQLLDEVFSGFDTAAAAHGVEKVKTIGDAYMAVAGLPEPHPDHAGAIVAFAHDMQAVARAASAKFGEDLALRIGVNSGPVVAGVIGKQRIIYDLWGDTVNVASRIEGVATPSTVFISDTTRAHLRGRGLFEPFHVHLKGKGPTTVYQFHPIATAA